MKSVFKIAIVTAAMMVAQPAFSKEVVKETKEVTKEEVVVKKSAKKHHRKHRVTKTETTAPVYGTGTRRYDHSTFLGYAIQGNGNPDEARNDARAVKRF